MPSGKGMTSNLQDLVGPLPGLTGDGLEGPQPIPRAYDTFYILYRLQQMLGLWASVLPFRDWMPTWQGCIFSALVPQAALFYSL